MQKTRQPKRKRFNSLDQTRDDLAAGRPTTRPPAKSKFQKDHERRQAHDAWLVAPATADESWFRHHNWEARRALVRQGLISNCANEFQLNRFDECGSECTVEFSMTENRYRLRANHCRCRHCAPCAKAKASLLAKNLKAKLEAGPKNGDRFRFITLTLRHDKSSELRPLITKLYECFRQLRKWKRWKESQSGGCSILEVKWSKDGGWHPHLHICCDGTFLRAEQLQREWHRITTDSFKADIRELKDIKDTCFYVSKYVGKGVNDEVWLHPPAAAEFICSMKGVRFAATFGTWRGFALLRPDIAHQALDWKPICTLNSLAGRARNGDDIAIQLLLALDEALTYNPHKKHHKRKDEEPPE